MVRRLILDTGVLIASERAMISRGDVLEADDDVALAAVSVAELRTGAELAGSSRQGRDAFLQQVLAAIPVESYDGAVLQIHGRLLATAHRAGNQRGAHELILAATAVAMKRTTVTVDRRARFGDLPVSSVSRWVDEPRSRQRQARLGTATISTCAGLAQGLPDRTPSGAQASWRR